MRKKQQMFEKEIFQERILTNKFIIGLKKIGATFLSLMNFKAWAVLHNRQKLKVDLASAAGRSIWLRGIYEPETEAYIRSVLKPGDVFIDIGAHLGYFSLIASELVAGKGKVYSFEPNKKILALFKKSIEFNTIKNIRAEPTAIWNKTEALVLDNWSRRKDSGFSYTHPPGYNLNRYSQDTVQATTLDKYANINIKQSIKLVKIDVNAGEYHVLLGMQKILQSQAPQLILEALDWSLASLGHDLEDVFILLNKYGYKAFDLKNKSIKNVDEARKRLQEFWVKNLIFKK